MDNAELNAVIPLKKRKPHREFVLSTKLCVVSRVKPEGVVQPVRRTNMSDSIGKLRSTIEGQSEAAPPGKPDLGTPIIPKSQAEWREGAKMVHWLRGSERALLIC